MHPDPIHRPQFAGSPFPLGAYPSAQGTRFAVHAPDATAVHVCLLDDDRHERVVSLEAPTFGIWHGVIAGVGAGQRYRYRVDGPSDPERGLRFDPQRPLLDPWGLRIGVGDDGAHVSVVTECPTPIVGPRLDTPWEDTVIYELHVGSYTARHPLVPSELRGTYLGLAQPCILEHLVSLGVTAVELLPVQAFFTEPSLAGRGMRNHWGYSPAGYFAPHPGYAAEPGGEITEFRAMVDALHGAGIEVLLDVVYNHTCEETTASEVISWRGFDHVGYYLLDDDGTDVDVTGCGNTLNANSPIGVRLVTDSLRYWAENLGVDGFRFDLASALGRVGGGEFDPAAPVLSAIAADPVLSRRKLIAEPWDATSAGYQLGGFDLMWSEWNGRYRDSVRGFWNGTTCIDELASRFAGSEDLFARRRPWASINFVTAHDGFTAADLVSYTEKHNEANGEDNRDGTAHNHSVNYGVEGPTEDAAIRQARERHVRNLLATLAVSTGTPMLLAGDEFGHSLQGNNNAYCVPFDTARTDAWPLDWENADQSRIRFVRHALALRHASPALRQPEFFEGRGAPTDHPDLVWFAASGAELDADSWREDAARTLQAWIDCSDVRSHNAAGQMLTDDSWLIVLHSGGPADVTLGCPDWFYGRLTLELDTRIADGVPEPMAPVERGATITLDGPTVLVLRACN